MCLFCNDIHVCCDFVMCVANYPGLAHEAIHRLDKDVLGWGLTWIPTSSFLVDSG
jgi:hypothetical protein